LLPELEEPVDGWVLRRLVPPSVRRAARVVTGTQWSKRDLVQRYGLPPEHIVVTPYGVDPVFTPDGPGPTGSLGPTDGDTSAAAQPYVLFVGALRPRKDPVTAVEALARLPEDLRLVMVGPPRGEERRVADTVGRLGLGPRVQVRGHVTRDELAALYRGAACMVLPSRYEGFGLPVLEAMASGTPVVTTTAGALPEVCGDAAVLVAPRQPDALADGVRRALAERATLVARGLERARCFSWEETARVTLELYRELAAYTPAG
jgi:glycosyltransferase involved in cell wall biosynthesis